MSGIASNFLDITLHDSKQEKVHTLNSSQNKKKNKPIVILHIAALVLDNHDLVPCTLSLLMYHGRFFFILVTHVLSFKGKFTLASKLEAVSLVLYLNNFSSMLV